MVEQSCDLSVRRQCELLTIHRSQLYYKPKGEGEDNMYIARLIDQQYQRTPFYGVPRMTTYLGRLLGVAINEKRVARLYKLMDLRAIGPNPNTSRRESGAYIHPYLLKGLDITGINQVWVSDITFLPMKRGFLYLYAIMDLFSRFIVNWSLSNAMTARWCKTTTEEAILKYVAPAIFNTDQGSQFTSEEHTDVLKAYGVQVSMDGKGRAIDNVFIERFWRSLKYEYFYLQSPNGGAELYNGIEEYMRFYNYERPHTVLNDMTPASVYLGAKATFRPTKYLASLV